MKDKKESKILAHFFLSFLAVIGFSVIAFISGNNPDSVALVGFISATVCWLVWDTGDVLYKGESVNWNSILADFCGSLFGMIIVLCVM